MKNKDQKIDTLALFSWIALLGIGILMGFVVLFYFVSEQQKISDLNIPQSTIDWFTDHFDGWDFGGRPDTTRKDPDSYENVDDMLCLEDEYFKIYYSKKDSANQHTKAEIALKYAHAAIPKSEKLMGYYPYPNKINGRKLPIYLAATSKGYLKIVRKLIGADARGTLGVYMFTYSTRGAYTIGIAIAPEAWRKSNAALKLNPKDEEFRQTLWHEMNHFMYFTNFNFGQANKPSLWYTEGLAEYFADNSNRLRTVGSHQRYKLTQDIQDVNAYWIGLSAFYCLTDEMSEAICSKMIQYSYDNSIDRSISMANGNMSIRQWDSDWHHYMQSGAYKKHLRTK